MNQTCASLLIGLLLSAGEIQAATWRPGKDGGKPLYLYTLAHDGTPTSYDESLAVASLQGIINRKSPELYVLSRKNTRPQFWLDLLAKDGRWLEGREQKRWRTSMRWSSLLGRASKAP